MKLALEATYSEESSLGVPDPKEPALGAPDPEESDLGALNPLKHALGAPDPEAPALRTSSLPTQLMETKATEVYLSGFLCIISTW